MEALPFTVRVPSASIGLAATQPQSDVRNPFLCLIDYLFIFYYYYERYLIIIILFIAGVSCDFGIIVG